MKKTIGYILFLMGFLLLLWGVSPTSDGLVVEMRISKNGEVSRKVFYIQKDKLKIVNENKSLIFFEDQLCLFDNKKKIFWEGNMKEFNKGLLMYRMRTGSPYSSRSQFFYQNLSEKDKHFFTGVINEISGKKTEEALKCEIFKTPNFTSIAGYASRKFEIRQAGEIVEEIWISDNLKNYLNYELDLDIYHDFIQSYLHHSESKLYHHLESFMEIVKNGLPMKIKMYQGESFTETTVENLIRKRIKNSVFILPEGFEKCNLKEVLN